MGDLPSGTVTFLLSDVEGSTKLWERDAKAMSSVLARHDELMSAAVEGSGGTLVRARGEGDSTFSVFARASDAVAGAVAAQRAIGGEDWPFPLRVRMAIGTGTAELREGEYHGAVIGRTGRLRAVAHGGQVLVAESTATLVREALPGGAGLADLGSHRLADLARPQRVFQVTHPDVAADFPPLRSVDAIANNLPVQLTAFVGREADIAGAAALLGAHRLVTLAGPGGIGKTRLALQVAAETLGRFGDGAWVVELDAIRDPEALEQAIATVLGARDEAGRSPLDAIVGAIGTRELLLVLDNCEQIVEPCARLADAMLRRCPRLRVLATSREPLQIGGETIWRLGSLASGDGASDAVRLFVDRATLANASFKVTPESAAAIEAVCRRLDGIPLAIELAAARTKVLSPDQIAKRLDDRLSLLTSTVRTALPRHQTLRAAIDWSYELLGEAEQALFRRLGVFAGPFPYEVVVRVVAGDDLDEVDVLDHLAGLADRSLVVVEEREGRALYRLLDTIRRYAEEKLRDAGEEPAARDRLLGWASRAVGHAWRDLLGPAQAQRLGQFDRALPNLRVALAWALEGEGDPVTGMEMAAAMQPYWELRGAQAEGRRWLELALARAPDAPPKARGNALADAGILAYRQGDLDAAQRMLEEALAVFGEAEDGRGIAHAQTNLGNVAWARGEYEAARARHADALEVRRGIGDRHGVWASLNNAGLVVLAQGDAAGARAMWEEALAIATERGDRAGEAATRGNLGLAAMHGGDLAVARSLHEGCLAIRRELEDRRGTAIALSNLGIVSLAEGDAASARTLHQDALAIRRGIGERRAVAQSQSNLGAVALVDGAVEEARALFAESLGVRRDLGDRAGIAESLDGLAAAAGRTGDGVRAGRLFGAAEALREAVGAPLGAIDAAALERERGTARAAAGDAFDAAVTEGRGLAPDDAIREALA